MNNVKFSTLFEESNNILKMILLAPWNFKTIFFDSVEIAGGQVGMGVEGKNDLYGSNMKKLMVKIGEFFEGCRSRAVRNLYFPYRLFTFFSLMFLLGVLVLSYLSLDFLQSWLIFLTAIAAFLFAGLINFLLKNKFLVFLSFACTALFAGALYANFYQHNHIPKINFGEKVEVVGRIVGKPELDYNSQKIVLQSDIYKTKVLVTVPHFPVYHFGEKIAVSGALQQPGVISGFDYGGYLKGKNIFAVIQRPEKITFLEKCDTFSSRLVSGLYSTSDAFENSLNRALPEPHASLAAGILLGVKRNIPDDFMADLQKTGLTHIIALSGFNVTIIIAVFASLALSYLGKKKTFYAGSALVLLFVVMTGAASSVIRAAVFSLLILFGKTIGRKADQLNIIILAAFLMILCNPYVLRYDLGFQLSFLAFLGLVWISPWLSSCLEKWRSWGFLNFTKKPLSETLGAQFAVTPIILCKFGLISIISPLANLLVVWIIPATMGLAFMAGLLGLLSNYLGGLCGLVLWPFLEYIIKAVEILARLPFAAISFNK